MRYKVYSNDNDKVVVTSTYAGKPVRGVAKCYVTDEFNKETGIKLAQARCDHKVAKKRYKNAINRYEDAKEMFQMAQEYLLDMREYAASSEKEMYEAEAHLESVLNELKQGRVAKW